MSSYAGRECIDVRQVDLIVHVYQLDEEGSVEERAEGDKVPSAREWMLPSRELQGLWERCAHRPFRSVDRHDRL